jgi:phospholipase/lecithinase/hemolysin
MLKKGQAIAKCLQWFLLILLVLPVNGFAGPFNTVVAFGDSLSDNGNLLPIEGQPEPDPRFYYQGRWSNGPVWVDYLKDPQHLDTALFVLAQNGAKTDGLVPPGLIEQVTVFITSEELTIWTDTLFVIWIGGNDFLNGAGDYQAAIDNFEEAMQRLIDAGARHLLLMNLPDLGAIPEILGTPEAEPASEFTENFNASLADLIDRFSAEEPQVNFYEFDVAALFDEVRSDPDAFGLVNVSDPSPNFAVADNFDGADHLFWDEIHPTTRMHALIADRVNANLQTQIPDLSPDSDDDDSSDLSCFIQTLWGRSTLYQRGSP